MAVACQDYVGSFEFWFPFLGRLLKSTLAWDFSPVVLRINLVSLCVYHNLGSNIKLISPRHTNCEAHYVYNQNTWKQCFSKSSASKILFVVGLDPIVHPLSEFLKDVEENIFVLNIWIHLNAFVLYAECNLSFLRLVCLLRVSRIKLYVYWE